MMAFDAYRCYLSLKNHFTKDHYDYNKYGGKTRATKEAIYKRKDRFWFEKFARQKNDKEVEDFFVSNFVSCSDPESMWIGEMIKDKKVDEIFDCSKGHPIILRKFLGGNISLETLVIYDRILGYGNNFDKKLKDPVWETVSRRVRKYTPFLNIDVFRYKKILKEVVIQE